MSDRPTLSELPESMVVDRRELLRSILGGAVAVAGVAAVGVAAVGTPNLARAATPKVCTTRDFRTNERDKKKALQQSRGGSREAKAKQEASIRIQSRYAESGPAPIWIDVNGLDLIEAEVELSSVDATDEKACTVTMDLRIDTLGKGNVKEAVARITKLLPPAPGKDSPFVTVTWGVDGDQAFDGYLDSALVAYDLFLPDATPVRALVRATFLLV